MPSLPFTRAEARLLPRLHERQELEEAANAHAHPDGPWGLERRDWTSADGEDRAALRCPVQPDREARNQIMGFEYADLAAAAPLFGWFAEAGCTAHARVSGADLRAPMALSMAAEGFRPKEVEVWLGARPDEVDPPPADLEITLAENAAERALWADIALAGWELPAAEHDVARGSLAPFPGPDHWRWLIARADGRPVGEALLVLFEDAGVAYLADAAVIPEGRGRGVQRALIGARAKLAAEAGYERLFAGATYGTASSVNMMRAGLAVAEITTLWERPPSA